MTLTGKPTTAAARFRRIGNDVRYVSLERAMAETETDLMTRRARAIAGIRLAVEDLRAVGVEVKVIGSLAKGRFGPHSDVDLLVVACPRHMKYTIEGKVEDHMDGIVFDVVYLDEVPVRKRAAFVDSAIDVSRLR